MYCLSFSNSPRELKFAAPAIARAPLKAIRVHGPYCENICAIVQMIRCCYAIENVSIVEIAPGLRYDSCVGKFTTQESAL